ncbi:DsbA family protein [Phormidium tenue]|uniref:Disulfide bond formation protein DsbA n=1 Tax=Phormidium tenue NIES-30 TaxID=549789 RepID=A0A1U7IY28_9CYAN|nr:DsbA family protein [Phormidium tenue]MBD2234958.1 DsbA family protein [Phormidium tenue FACHB-1052]OKH43195.1 disulfide bond formation protein DsbA [Phormidium tenue NIES-30]
MSDDRSHRSLLVPPSTQDWIQGILSAKVVLVMYGDYQCPRSANVYKLIKAIKRELSAAFGEDSLCFIFRHFPQTQIYPHSQRAAQAAEAAAAQGQFWLMSDTLFDNQQRLENGYLVEYANDLGLDIPQFLKDLPKQVHIDRINEDIEGGIQSGVTTAPALFINGSRYIAHWNTTELMAAMIAASH